MSSRARLQAAVTNANVRAFLRAIRLGEGTSDDLGYMRLVGGGEFRGFADHPRVVNYALNSSAAGAYQFIRRTWDALVRQYGFEDFGPQCQDEAAVALILEKRALDDVIAGRVARAVELCAPVWASLPGSTAGQRTERLESVIAEYQKHGGDVVA